MHIWTYIPLDRFSRPEEPRRKAVLDSVNALWLRLRHGAFMTKPVSVQAEFRSASLRLLDRVAPSPRWGAAERAVESSLADWKAQERPEQTTQFVVGPPGTGTRHVTQKWAERNGYRIIRPPSYRQIIEGNQDWLRQLEGDDPVALPSLECFFVRHYNGLVGMRKLLDRILSGPRRHLIGCSSWAWAYLNRTVQINVLVPQPLVLAAFDGARLQRWFHVLALSGGGGSLVFRLADDGSSVLPPVAGSESSDVAEEADAPGDDERPAERPSLFLVHLAARSRGNPLAAWALWRQSLHIGNDEAVEEEAQEAAAADRGRTIWIRPWSELSLPEVPPGIGTADLLLLHSLLLHDGLPADILDMLLPSSLGEIMQKLYRLRSEGLVKLEEGMWRVTLLGYPAVRKVLSDEDYLVDEF